MIFFFNFTLWKVTSSSSSESVKITILPPTQIFRCHRLFRIHLLPPHSHRQHLRACYVPVIVKALRSRLVNTNSPIIQTFQRFFFFQQRISQNHNLTSKSYLSLSSPLSYSSFASSVSSSSSLCLLCACDFEGVNVKPSEYKLPQNANFSKVFLVHIPESSPLQRRGHLPWISLYSYCHIYCCKTPCEPTEQPKG